jgi:hypothetical protein
MTTAAYAQIMDQDIDRNNEIDQSIAQSNEACTNSLVAIEDDEGDQSVNSGQENACLAFQSNGAEQKAKIDDQSTNFLANFAAIFG